ncbi:MAG: hypothetical protein H8D35_02030 [Nitrosopumilus sp.]|nr:hypothetical protein [Nitrosopumilus sp.]
MINTHADSLKGINVDKTIANKVESVIIFFSTNDIKIQNDLVFDHLEECYEDDFEQ